MRQTSGALASYPSGFGGGLDAARAFEPLAAELTLCATVDPHDETLETEITEEMISEAIAAMDDDSAFPAFPYKGGSVAVPFRTARIIRFPGADGARPM